MKLLFFTDTHIRGNSPENRIDDYPTSLEEKFTEVVDIINREEVDYVLHGGDLFDRPDVSMAVINRFTKILSRVRVPIYMVSGNHDVYGHNPSTIRRTVLSLLDTLETINLVGEDDLVILEKDSTRVQLTGQPYTFSIDGEDKLSYYSPRQMGEDVDYRIHMVHGMLLDRPFLNQVKHTIIDEVKDTQADILLSGHYHGGYRTQEVNGTYFINPGSLVRISNSLIEMERRPKVIILDLGEELNIREIELEVAKPSNEVLDRKKLEAARFKSERLYEFKQTIDSTSDFDKLELNDILMEVSKLNETEEEVVKEALYRIGLIQEKNKEMGD